MKRLPIIACVAATLLMVVLVVFRRVTKKESTGKPTQAQVEQVRQRVTEFVSVQTHPLSPQAFDKAVRERAGTGTETLEEAERERLFSCLSRFYLCYSSGDFAAFSRFRLLAPFAVDSRLTSAMRQIASEKGLILKSDEDILRLAWGTFNGTNRMTAATEESISLTVVRTQDLAQRLRRSSTVSHDGAFGGSICWDGAVAYKPSAETLLNTEGSLRWFRLELNVRFNGLQGGPATPVVVMGYWDPTRKDWMPYVCCVAFRVGGFDTIF